MMQHERTPSGLTRMSEGNRYEVSDEDPDPRGWPVVSTDGSRIGEVRDLLVDDAALKVRYFEVELDDAGSEDRPVLVDAREVDLSDNREVILYGATGVDMLHSSSTLMSDQTNDVSVAHDRGHLGDEAARMTRAEEELRIGKREVEAGELVVNKSVETEHVSQPVERRVERVRVERRPVTAASAGMDARIDNGEIRVPIVEEEVVVEKRPIVKEEIIVTRDVDTETEVVEADVRKERVDVHEEGRTGNAPPANRGGRRGQY
jgi:uncharacterized protein (TIGR02271 family)